MLNILPKAFVWKRLHSLSGLWLTGFLFLHLLTNSQSALMVGEDGYGFIKAANGFRDLPYLNALEIVFLAIPFAVHIYWGLVYLQTGLFNSGKTDGTEPSLPEYPRNHAYTWQRITSWVLLVLIALHVIQMRFMDKPLSAHLDGTQHFIVRITQDPGLETVASRLNVSIYNQKQIQEMIEENKHLSADEPNQTALQRQKINEQINWIHTISSVNLDKKQVIAVANSFGAAELLMVRETFKDPAMMILYTVLVLSACFHGFNGLWTFMITWGATISPYSQNLLRKISTFLMFLVAFMGLAAVWGTYWINLYD